jgi:hypothetical protein
LQQGSPPAHEYEQRTIVLQHDPYVNCSAVRKGRYKLILGAPGAPWRVDSPTSNWFINVAKDAGHMNTVNDYWPYTIVRGTVAENLADILDMPSLTILSYVVAMLRGVMADWLAGTHHRNMLVSADRDYNALSVRVEDSIPTLEISRSDGKGGAHTFLYDIEQGQFCYMCLAVHAPGRAAPFGEVRGARTHTHSPPPPHTHTHTHTRTHAHTHTHAHPHTHTPTHPHTRTPTHAHTHTRTHAHTHTRLGWRESGSSGSRGRLQGGGGVRLD